MEKAASPPSGPNTAKTTVTTPRPSHTPPESRQRDLATRFASMFHSFPPDSPTPHRLSVSPSPSTSSDDLHLNLTPQDSIAAPNRLNHARLILQYQQLCDQFDLCLARLKLLSNDVYQLEEENVDLRAANSELVKLLNLSSQAAIHRSLQREPLSSNFTSKMCQHEAINTNAERISLPKSISVRSSGYLKMNQPQGPSRMLSRNQLAAPFVSGTQQACVALGGRSAKEEAVQLEVYNQGMAKTELCNKWQETGTCPYGDQCQFAHGITELRPVIRHPRYKSEVCRMILAGDPCPYSHRCHFRHSLTEQERLLLRR